MTFNSTEMIKAAKESIWNYQTITEEEQVIAREFFYRGALWAASKMEEADRFDPCCMKCGNPLLTDELVCKECKPEETRQCKIIDDGLMGFHDYECGNCRASLSENKSEKFCSYRGYKFIKGE